MINLILTFTLDLIHLYNKSGITLSLVNIISNNTCKIESNDYNNTDEISVIKIKKSNTKHWKLVITDWDNGKTDEMIERGAYICEDWKRVEEDEDWSLRFDWGVKVGLYLPRPWMVKLVATIFEPNVYDSSIPWLDSLTLEVSPWKRVFLKSNKH